MMGKYFGNCTKEIRLLAMYDCAQDCLLLSSRPTKRQSQPLLTLSSPIPGRAVA